MDGLISLFLLPVLAGYLVLTKARLYSIRTSTYSMPRLLAESLIYGIGLLYVAYFLADTFLFFNDNEKTSLGIWLSKIWAYVALPLAHEVGEAEAGKHFTNQALLSVIIAFLYIFIENLLSEEIYKKIQAAPLVGHLFGWFGWLLSRHNSRILKERDKIGGSIERLFALSMNTVTPVQITMKNRKVYVAVIKDLPTLSPVIKQQRFVNIIPIQSGYRKTENLTVELDVTNYNVIFDLLLMQNGVSPPDRAYAKKLKKILDEGDGTILENLSMGIAIDSDEIISVSLWDQNIFHEFKEAEKKAP
jgi:hypothetical protein